MRPKASRSSCGSRELSGKLLNHRWNSALQRPPATHLLATSAIAPVAFLAALMGILSTPTARKLLKWGEGTVSCKAMPGDHSRRGACAPLGGASEVMSTLASLSDLSGERTVGTHPARENPTACARFIFLLTASGVRRDARHPADRARTLRAALSYIRGTSRRVRDALQLSQHEVE